MIRKVRPGDSSDICKISCEELGYDCSETLVKSHIENLDDSREAVFVEEKYGMVIGFVHVEKYATLYLEPMANILGLAVKKEYQHTGIGRKLMNEVEQWAKECDVHYIRANSGASRPTAHNFYRELGFDSEKEQIRFLKHI